MEIVAVERCESYERETIRSALVRLLEPLGGMGAFVHSGERVLIKPNMLSAKAPEKAKKDGKPKGERPEKAEKPKAEAKA